MRTVVVRQVLTVEQEPLWAWSLVAASGIGFEVTVLTAADGVTPTSTRSTDPGLMFGAVLFTVPVRDSEVTGGMQPLPARMVRQLGGSD
mgnify:CR=1 FL=1